MASDGFQTPKIRCLIQPITTETGHGTRVQQSLSKKQTLQVDPDGQILKPTTLETDHV